MVHLIYVCYTNTSVKGFVVVTYPRAYSILCHRDVSMALQSCRIGHLTLVAVSTCEVQSRFPLFLCLFFNQKPSRNLVLFGQIISWSSFEWFLYPEAHSYKHWSWRQCLLPTSQLIKSCIGPTTKGNSTLCVYRERETVGGGRGVVSLSLSLTHSICRTDDCCVPLTHHIDIKFHLQLPDLYKWVTILSHFSRGFFEGNAYVARVTWIQVWHSFWPTDLMPAWNVVPHLWTLMS